MEERNSEGTAAKIVGVIAAIAIVTQAAFLKFSELPVAENLTWIGMVNSALGLAAKVAWEYVKGRPAKRQSLANEKIAEAALIKAKSEAAELGK